MKEVWFSVMMERSIYDRSAIALFDVMRRAGRLGYRYISVPYGPIVTARNSVIEHFMNASSNPDDTLIMLDCDHAHPFTVLEDLVDHDLPFVSALTFRRTAPYDPLIYRLIDGELRQPSNPGTDLVEIDATGFGAVAIKREVFLMLGTAGIEPPWVRYEWREAAHPVIGDDIYLCLLCKQAGIRMYCDTRIVLPHLTLAEIDESQWKEFQANHSVSGKYVA